MLCGLTATALLLQPVHATPAGDEVTSLAADPSKDQADALVTLKGGLISAGIGYEWGHGTVKVSLAGTRGCPHSNAQKR
jgi:hypothetical protein